MRSERQTGIDPAQPARSLSLSLDKLGSSVI